MKRLQHPAILAFGAATIMVFLLLAPLASSTHEELYHLSSPVRILILPVLLNLAAVWLVLTLLLLWARQSRRVQRVIYPLLGVGLSWMMLKDAFVLTRNRPIPASVNHIFLLAVLAVGIFLAVARRRDPHIMAQAKDFGLTVLSFLALASMVQVGGILVTFWQVRHLNTPRALHHEAASPRAAHARILWVVLDELSYRQVYEQRYPGLRLPAFDRLAAGASVFTHTVPAGESTEDVLPSLMTGVPVEKIAFPAAGTPVRLKDMSSGAWVTLDPHRTVFQDALNAGYATAVAGWYNPYCRMLSDVLDQCFWTQQTELPGGMAPSAGVLWNARQPFKRQIARVLSKLHLRPATSPGFSDLIGHESSYRQLAAASDRLLGDPSANFVLLHMPIPHPDGIYRMDTRKLAESPTTYIDNLALCDVYLGRLRQELEQNGSWDSTTIVLMGDHSWRTWLWSKLPGWTKEEQIASDGATFDDRPFYLVKLAGQTTPLRIDTPFSAVRTRSLFDALLAGQITTPPQLADWAAEGEAAERH